MSSATKAAPLARTKKLSSTTTKSAPTPPPPAQPRSPTPPPAAVVDTQQEAKSNETLTSGVKIKNKLETLSNRFDGFEDELNLSRNKKKAEEDKRILILQTQLNNLQSSLALESKNRAISVKALQNWLTDRIAQWTKEIEAPMTARLNTLQDSLTFLNSRLDALEHKQNEDRLTFPKLIDGRCEELLRDIQGLKAKFEANILTREEKEKRILLKVQNESNKIAVQFSQDKLIADDKIRQLREAISEEESIRAKGTEMVRATLLEEVALIKADILKEKKERELADEDLVQAINHYSAALQDGIKIVSTQ